MELVHCICDCVHNILQDNIPMNDEEKERLRPHRHCMRKLVDEKTSDRERKRIIQDGGISRISHPDTRRISRKTVHRTMMVQMVTKKETDGQTFVRVHDIGCDGSLDQLTFFVGF